MPTSRKVSSNGFKPANTLCLDSYSVFWIVLGCSGCVLCESWIHWLSGLVLTAFLGKADGVEICQIVLILFFLCLIHSYRGIICLVWWINVVASLQIKVHTAKQNPHLHSIVHKTNGTQAPNCRKIKCFTTCHWMFVLLLKEKSNYFIPKKKTMNDPSSHRAWV